MTIIKCINDREQKRPYESAEENRENRETVLDLREGRQEQRDTMTKYSK